MHPTLVKLGDVIDSMPDCNEKIVLTVIRGNMLCGKSSQSLAEAAHSMAKQYLEELNNPQ